MLHLEFRYRSENKQGIYYEFLLGTDELYLELLHIAERLKCKKKDKSVRVHYL